MQLGSMRDLKNVTIVAAVADNNVIGSNGRIPWRIPEDLKRFQELTVDNTLTMGRKTYESIGHALTKRTTIVITSDTSWDPGDVLVAHDFYEAMAMALTQPGSIIIAGGQQVYTAAMPAADHLIITEIHQEPYGDTFFPIIDSDQWTETHREARDGFDFVSYCRAK